MRFIQSIPFLLVALAAYAARAESPADLALRQFLDAEWQRHLAANPIDATLLGDHRFDRELPDRSPAGVEKDKRARRAARQQLATLIVPGLAAAPRLNAELYAWLLDRDLAADKFCEECLVLSPSGGPHETIADLLEIAPPQSAKEAEDLLVRMDKFPDYLAQQRAWLERGLQQKIVAPRAIMEKVPAQIRKQIDKPVEQSAMLAAFAKLPDKIPAAERQRLVAAFKQKLADKIFPAIRAYADFVEQQYLPRCTTTVGLSALPDGKAWYRQRVLRYTTLPLDPEAIHQLGLAEVARITAEMEKVKQAAGFAGTLAQYFTFLRTDRQFYYTDRDELLRGYRDIAKRIDAELPRLFGKLPRLPYGVTPVPAYSEEAAYTASYFPGSLAAGRAGRFYANTYKVETRPRWEMEALTLHEAVPGHHLQIALAQELTDVPTFRQELYIEAFGEGWGLYAESLGGELGLYQTPAAKMGQLIYEMWRAVRLVVDTGLHWKGWTRQQAVQYFVEHTGKSTHDIGVEVDRYIGWPGQALAYKIGQRQILALRKQAEAELGARFDVRAFHDAVLEAGALPLPLLESRIKQYIATAKSKP